MNGWMTPVVFGLSLLSAGQGALQERVDAPWIEASHRRSLAIEDIRYVNQDGAHGVLGGLVNKPLVLAFFYTRCQNAAKCSMTVSRLASLQQILRSQHLDGKVRILAITYEPQFDTPDKVHRFGADRGLEFGPNAQALQIDTADLTRLVDAIEAPVNYNAGWVNTHGVELNLLDSGGRLVRRYPSIAWDNNAVAVDVRRLLSGK